MEAGLSQLELAEDVGASRSAISAIERERAIPSVTLGIAIARRLGTNVEALFAPLENTGLAVSGR